MNYKDKLTDICKKNDSVLVIGLDTDLKKIPAFFQKYKNPVLEFNKFIIEHTKELSAGYKLNIAFYEFLEGNGIEALRETVKFIPENMLRICDCKRGDIENTAEMYAGLYFDKYDFDSVTVSPYMGRDALSPFLKRKDKLVYVLALTSNNSFADIQMQKTDNKFLYEQVIEFSLELSDGNNVGFVFGANHTEEIMKFTGNHPNVPLLIPGIGAQKNDLTVLMKSINSRFAVINTSRAVIYAAPADCPEIKFGLYVIDAAVKIRDEIKKYRINR